VAHLALCAWAAASREVQADSGDAEAAAKLRWPLAAVFGDPKISQQFTIAAGMTRHIAEGQVAGGAHMLFQTGR